MLKYIEHICLSNFPSFSWFSDQVYVRIEALSMVSYHRAMG